MKKIEIPEKFFGITVWRKPCNKAICSHKQNDCNGGYYCLHPRNALFVRHARIDKRGRKYSYGDYYCAAKVALFSNPDMFSSSEKNLLKSLI